MPYNYTKEFLAKHHGLVEKIIRIAQSGEIIMYTDENPGHITRRQELVNNILANIARNIQGYEDIRTKVRCWTAYRHEQYTLFVGRPQGKLAGRPPGGDLTPEWVTAIAPSQASPTYRHDQVITDAPSYDRFIGLLTALPGHHTHVEVRFPEEAELSLQALDDIFQLAKWHIIKNHNNRLTLERMA